MAARRYQLVSTTVFPRLPAVLQEIVLLKQQQQEQQPDTNPTTTAAATTTTTTAHFRPVAKLRLPPSSTEGPSVLSPKKRGSHEFQFLHASSVAVPNKKQYLSATTSAAAAAVGASASAASDPLVRIRFLHWDRVQAQSKLLATYTAEGDSEALIAVVAMHRCQPLSTAMQACVQAAGGSAVAAVDNFTFWSADYHRCPWSMYTHQLNPETTPEQALWKQERTILVQQQRPQRALSPALLS